MADCLIADPSLLAVPTGLQARGDGAMRHELLSQHGEEQSPASARLTALIEARLRAAGVGIATQLTGWVR